MNRELEKEIEKFNKFAKESKFQKDSTLEVKPYQSKRRKRQRNVNNEHVSIENQNPSSNSINKSMESLEDSEEDIHVNTTYFEIDPSNLDPDSIEIVQSIELEEPELGTWSSLKEKENEKKQLTQLVRNKLKKENKHLLNQFKPIERPDHYIDPLKRVDSIRREEILRTMPRAVYNKIGYNVTPEEARKSQQHTQRKWLERLTGKNWKQN